MGMRDRQNLPPAPALAERALEILEAHWRPEGFAVPNGSTYPHQWLWDSCFHAVVWARCGRPTRAIDELRAAFERQGPDGFVPHMIYRCDEGRAGVGDGPGAFWKRSGSSCITQPPMFGHGLAEVGRTGAAVPSEVVEAATRAMGFLLGPRRTDSRDPAGGVRVIHPWETGCDDSPRWDIWCPGHWSPDAWYRIKGELVASIEDPRDHTPQGAVMDERRGPVHNPRFEVHSAGFDALVAFNALELASTIRHHSDPLLRLEPSASELEAAAAEIATSLQARWEPETATWVDTSPGGTVTGRQRTADSLLPALVVQDQVQVRAALDQLADPDAFGSLYGVAGVHRAEPSYDPDRYWRGPVWPQLTYLLALAAQGAGRYDLAATLAGRLRAGAERSGWSEHWHPDTGAAQGAAPQSWTTLAAIL